MKKYIAHVKMRIKNEFNYKVSTLAGIAVAIIQVYILYYIWKNVYDNTASMNGYSLDQMITYVILSSVIYSLIELGITLKVADLVKTGDIVLWMVKPIGFIRTMLLDSAGSLLANIFTMAIPILVFSILSIGMYFQKDILTNLVFIISVILSIIISMYIDLIFGLLTFWTENGWGLRVIRQSMIKLFSGALIPISFFPETLRNICNVLPFKSLVEIPLNIYIFGVNGDAAWCIANQFFWVIILSLAVKMMYKYIVLRLDVNGG